MDTRKDAFWRWCWATLYSADSIPNSVLRIAGGAQGTDYLPVTGVVGDPFEIPSVHPQKLH